MAGSVPNGHFYGIFRLPFRYGAKNTPSYMMKTARSCPLSRRSMHSARAMVRLDIGFHTPR